MIKKLRGGGGAPPKTPSPDQSDHREKNEIYKRENLVAPFLVHKFLGPKPPPPLPPPPPGLAVRAGTQMIWRQDCVHGHGVRGLHRRWQRRSGAPAALESIPEPGNGGGSVSRRENRVGSCLWCRLRRPRLAVAECTAPLKGVTANDPWAAPTNAVSASVQSVLRLRTSVRGRCPGTPHAVGHTPTTVTRAQTAPAAGPLLQDAGVVLRALPRYIYDSPRPWHAEGRCAHVGPWDSLWRLLPSATTHLRGAAWSCEPVPCGGAQRVRSATAPPRPSTYLCDAHANVVAVAFTLFPKRLLLEPPPPFFGVPLPAVVKRFVG